MNLLGLLCGLTLITSCTDRVSEQDKVTFETHVENNMSDAVQNFNGADPYFVKDEKISFSNSKKFNNDLQEFREKMKVYIDNNGHIIAHTEHFVDNRTYDVKFLSNNFFSGDAETLYQLELNGMSEVFIDGASTYSGGFDDDNYKRTNITIRDNKLKLECNEKTANYVLADEEKTINVRNKVTFVPLPPEARQGVWLFKFKDRSEYIYVDRRLYNTADYRLFVGKAGAMMRKEIKGMLIIDDGGTSHSFSTVEGDMLFAPSSYNPNKPQWNLEDLIELYPYSDIRLLGLPLSFKPKLVTPCDDI